MKLRYSRIVKMAMVAAIYAALTMGLAPISYGPIQVRIADALLPLPYLEFFGLPSAIGLSLGCALANMLSPYAIYDIAIGSIANLFAGTVAWFIGKIYRRSLYGVILASLAQTAIVTFMVGYLLLHLLFNVELSIAILGVFSGSIISISILGTMLVMFLMRRVA